MFGRRTPRAMVEDRVTDSARRSRRATRCSRSRGRVVETRTAQAHVEQETGAERLREIDGAVEHIGPIREQRAASSGRTALPRVELGRVGGIEPLVDGPVRRVAPGDEVCRRSAGVYIREVEERLDVPPGWFHPRGKERVVPVRVQRLLVV